VDKVEVQNTRETGIPKENFEAFFRQKPNRKMFREFHFFVWWYNLFDADKLLRRKIERNMKYDRINAERIRKTDLKNKKRARKGKSLKQPKLKDKESPLLRESVRDIGEPAVVYDSTLTEQTRFQLTRYLFSKGFFNNVVQDSVRLIRGSKRAHVIFKLIPKKPYTISEITYDIPDPELAGILLSQPQNSLLHKDMQFDEELFQAERQRLTDVAVNNGYFYFENAYIDYWADTAKGNLTASLRLKVARYSAGNGDERDSSRLSNHPRFKLKNVYLITEPSLGSVRNLYFKDTITATRKNIKFLLNGPLAYRRKILIMNTDLYPGQYYRKDTATLTYKQLLGLGLFRNVTIQFFPSESGDKLLDCYIVCNPLSKQFAAAEIEGTNTSGNLGIDGNLVFQNRNSFKGAELIEVKLLGAIVAQRQFNTADSAYASGVDDVSKLQNTFNTIQFGPEIRFSVPRALFPFSVLPFRKDQEPRTFVKTSLNYQTRPEFSRVITNAEYGFTFKTNNKQLRHEIIPLEVYMVKARLDGAFRNALVSYKDAFLLNSFQDHVTTVTKYGLTFTSKENTVNGKRTAYYARVNLQSSGNLLRQVYKWSGQTADTLGRFLLAGIPFAQFVKTDIDLRMYVPVRERSRIVYRIAAGIGKPLKNLNILPYEQSFFSGGPNSVRAWRARTLGPGGYDPRGNTTRFDKIGDLLLEGNIEYRFHMIRSFYGALFADAGNIWRLRSDENKPGGEFNVNTFLDQIAVGGGIGIRWDLTFIVLRLDLAMPLKDPKMPAGQRWVLDKKPYEYTVANFGIGYPF
jgi:outer membrane protein assembly factor BamA